MVVGEDTLISILEAALGWIKEGINKVFEIGVNIYNIVQNYIQLLTQTFAYDSPRKTLMMSFIWFGLVIGLILLFSGQSWKTGGIKTTDKQLEVEIDYGQGNGEIGGGGGIPNGSVTSTTLKNFGICQVNSDCDHMEQGEIIKTYLCCDPTTYKGYSCAGHCLKDSAYTLDYCKHPNSCQYEGSFNSFVGDDGNRCDNQNNANTFCQTRTANNTSTCCFISTEITPCYGYCLFPGNTNCNDPNDCYSERIPITIRVTGGDT